MKNILKFSIIIFGLMSILWSCEKAQTIHHSSIPEEGVYIYGSAIYLDSIHLDDQMDAGVILNSAGEVES